LQIEWAIWSCPFIGFEETTETGNQSQIEENVGNITLLSVYVNSEAAGRLCSVSGHAVEGNDSQFRIDGAITEGSR